MAFSALPEDILLEIFLRLSIIDALSLKQTCRVLHVVGSLDYLWHQLASNLGLALDVPPDRTLSSLKGAEIQQTAVEALRLERNWQKATSRIKRLTPVRYGIADMSIDEMQLSCGGRWLVTAQRNRLRGRISTTITIWSLKDITDVYRAACFEAPGYFYQYAARISRDEAIALVALTVMMNSEELLQIYEVPLGERLASDYSILDQPRLRNRIGKPHGAAGIFYHVSICDNLVAASLVEVSVGPNTTHRVCLINTLTDAQCWINIQPKECLSRWEMRLFSDQIVFVGSMDDALVVRTYNLPICMLMKGHGRMSSYTPVGQTFQQDDLGDPILDCVVAKLPQAMTFFTSKASELLGSPSSTTPPTLTFLTFRFLEGVPSRLYAARVPLRCTKSTNCTKGHNHGTRFAVSPSIAMVPSAQTAERVQIGVEGRRAVWLDRNLETEEVKVMKLSALSTNGISSTYKVGVLLPEYPVLPFRPSACRSLAFDEVTGRLCLGLFTGEFYVLDF
ncbi:hypothetical protein JAAARDRAFT_57193 [Jaapia argillacea MUCL 33604]|uniref:F-box domain-containing protein n=1 Tax=Jaapia argillacea MUCL 33604 TaxID=933084 RepID=A0A067Q9K8_9AGAM|nr:hypothetical protein JAAARDRAFT_57193 [Jaapia argillacea MUCL 33604]